MATPDPRTLDGVDVQVHLGVGCFGPAGTTAEDLEGFGAGLHALFDGLAPIITVEPIAATQLVGYEATESTTDTTLIRPTRVRYATRSHGVNSYGWLELAPNPWQNLLEMAARLGRSVRIRATILATEPSVVDTQEVERIIEQARDARMIDGAGYADPNGPFAREIAALQRRLSPPVFVSELAVASDRPLAEPEMRGIVANFLQQEENPPGPTRNDPYPVASGGIDIVANPNGHLHALENGVPLYGGVSARSLLDVVDLANIPVGLPWPTGARLTGIPNRSNVPEPHLRIRHDQYDSSARLGITGTTAIGLPDRVRGGHVAVSGAAGAGKSTVLSHLIHHDLDNYRPFLLIDTNGDLTEYIHGLPPGLRRCMIIDPSDRTSRHFAFVPPISPAGKNRPRVERCAALSADAVVKMVPPTIGTDPRFWNLCFAAFELQSLTKSSVAGLVELLAEPTRLRQVAVSVELSPRSKHQFEAVRRHSSEEQTLLSVLVALLDQLGQGERRPILGRPGKALNFDDLVCFGPPIALNLSGLTPNNRSLVCSFIVAHLLDALARRKTPFSTYHVYLDGADNLPPHAITDLFTAARRTKMGATVAITNPTALSSDVAAAFWSADTWLRLRSTPTAPDTPPAAPDPTRPDTATLGRYQLLLSSMPHHHHLEVQLDTRNERGRTSPKVSATNPASPTDANPVDVIKNVFPGAALVERPVN